MKLNENIIFTYPNRDYGYKEIIKILKISVKKIIVIKNLGVYNYYQFLKYSDLLIGNSSSGIIDLAILRYQQLMLVIDSKEELKIKYYKL